MKKSSSIALISAGILATIVSVVPMTSPATAQTVTGTGTQGTGTERTGTTTTNYERNNDNSGLWGLSGLLGLFGLVGRKKEESNTRRDDAPVYRDPSTR